jgi:hypothetical protein
VPSPHPLQAALDRTTRAAYSVVDLLDIAADRQPETDGRRARPDARQTSLYKAAITASVGGLEEAFEGMAAAGLVAMGLPTHAVAVLERALALKMQNPNATNVRGLLTDFVGYDPASSWSATLRTSHASYIKVKSKAGGIALESYYGQHETYTGGGLAAVLDRFVNVRHSFAHQDSSKGVLTKQEITRWFGPLWTGPANTADEKSFVRSLLAVCAVRLADPTSGAADPVDRWTVHETHALNALHLLLGVVSTSVSGLAGHLEAQHGLVVAAHDPLVLRVQGGAWSRHMDVSYVPASPHVTVDVVPYAPTLR